MSPQAETLLNQPTAMNKERLQKSFSDVSSEIKQYIRDTRIQKEDQDQNCNCSHDKDDNDHNHDQSYGEEVKQVECDCCGLKEDCTLQYINRVKSSYSGKWVCGLCAEVVNERLRRKSSAMTQVTEALDWHRRFCQEFNSTTRLNPKLSFTYSMRDIAKRSSQSRITKVSSSLMNISRTTSCGPRIDI